MHCNKHSPAASAWLQELTEQCLTQPVDRSREASVHGSQHQLFSHPLGLRISILQPAGILAHVCCLTATCLSRGKHCNGAASKKLLCHQPQNDTILKYQVGFLHFCYDKAYNLCLSSISWKRSPLVSYQYTSISNYKDYLLFRDFLYIMKTLIVVLSIHQYPMTRITLYALNLYHEKPHQRCLNWTHQHPRQRSQLIGRQ